VLDLSGASAYGFYVPATSPPTVRIEGFTLRNATGQQPIKLNSGAEIENCVFDSNQSGGAGGAISVHFSLDAVSADVRIEACAFLHNQAAGHGGAVLVSGTYSATAAVRVSNCVFDDNSAGPPAAIGNGGALYVSAASLELRNCVLTRNRAAYGAALYFTANGGTPGRHVSIQGSTLQGNLGTAPGSSAVALLGGSFPPTDSASLRNSILWGNTSPDSPALQLFASEFMDAEIAWSTVQFGTAGASGPFTVGPGMKAKNPLFVGASAGDVHLGPGSPCRDAGDPAYAALPGETDIDGEVRVFGPAIDQGADEAQP
jgi:predicted outer membrane repeat protein